MLIGSYRWRSRSINWSVMPCSSSRGVDPRPKQNIPRILLHPKNLLNNLQEFERICISLSQKNNQCSEQWHDGITHTYRLRVDTSWMLIGSFRWRWRSINWSVMPYSSSGSVDPRPKQNITRILLHPKNLMSNLQELERIYISLS
jgi:hypothetical protein